MASELRDRRMALTRKVMKELGRGDFQDSFSIRDPDGSRPVLVALPSDRVSEVVAKIRSMSGSCNIVIEAEPGELWVLALSRNDPAAPDQRDAFGDPLQVVHQDIDMRMLVLFIQNQPDRQATVNIVMPGVRASVPSMGRMLVHA